MTNKEFHAHCRSAGIFGYRFREDETQPSTHQELVELVARRVLKNEVELSFSALTQWLMSMQQKEGSKLDCSKLDVELVTAVVLMGDLRDPDSYVARIPDGKGHMQPFPPAGIVRQIIADEQT